MSRVYNFSPGPSPLPDPVIERIRQEVTDWEGMGVSVMEVSHRHPRTKALAESAKANLRYLLSIPEHYEILFCQGGGRAQYTMIPMNLSHPESQADYVVTGIWSQLAFDEAQHWCHANEAVNASSNNFTTIADPYKWTLNPKADYLHYVDNETIHGIEFPYIPDSDTPLVSDMTSNLLTRPVDISKFSLIYAACQKNLGIAGLTVVIIDPAVLKQRQEYLPPMHDYQCYIKHQSFYNTPPIFALYVTSLVLDWMVECGGIKPFNEKSRRQSAALYELIDNSDFYQNNVDAFCRSRINIPFTLKDDTLTETFISEAEANGLFGLKGHRLTGGVRASLYNAVTEEATDALMQFMKEFAWRHQHS